MPRAKKLNISLNEEINEKLNQKMKTLGVSRSAYVAMALTNQFKMDLMTDNMPEILRAMKEIAAVEKMTEAEKAQLRQIAMFDEKK